MLPRQTILGLPGCSTPSAGTISDSAAGHLAFIQSHVAREITCPVVFAPAGDQPTCYQVEQRTAGAGKPPFNNTAFWILAVEPTVISDHGDIWNLSFVEMLGQLMAPRGFFEPGTGRIKLSAAPATPGTK